MTVLGQEKRRTEGEVDGSVSTPPLSAKTLATTDDVEDGTLLIVRESEDEEEEEEEL